jgi:signal transduction histidine kinase
VFVRILSIIVGFGAVGLLGLLMLLARPVDLDRQDRLQASITRAQSLHQRIANVVLKSRREAADHGKALERMVLELERTNDETLRLAREYERDDGSWVTTVEAAIQELVGGSIGVSVLGSGLDPEGLLDVYMSASRAQRDATLDFARLHGDVVAARARIRAQGTSLVRGLRRSRSNAQADAIFSLVLNVLDVTGAATRVAPDEVAKSLNGAMSSRTPPAARKLIVEMAKLVDQGRERDAKVEDIVAPLAADHLTRLDGGIRSAFHRRARSAEQTRVLLNVYSVALFGVIGLLGVRLKQSLTALNRSKEGLEAMNISLEERVEERTRELGHAYQTLKESQVQLVQAEKLSSLGQLIAGIAHEINTPLLYVRNNTAMVEEGVGELREWVETAEALLGVLRKGAKDKEALRRYMARLEKLSSDGALKETVKEIATLSGDSADGLDQIGELVQGLRDFSRLDRAEEDRFDVNEGLEKTLLITRNMLKHGIEVEKRLGDVPAIQCAPMRINQVFVNLITNAAQAMQGKGKLRVETRKKGNRVVIAIQDTGCGIPEDQLGAIFDPFFTTKPVGQGTGLGLSIVKSIIDEHDGEIEARSKVGKGTTFIITLPIDGKEKKQAA